MLLINWTTWLSALIALGELDLDGEPYPPRPR
jgi:hypothetical protein